MEERTESEKGMRMARETDDIAAHEAAEHASAHVHHGHSHAPSSHHAGGHHLLQVEDLTVSFSMYDVASGSFFGAKKVESRVIDALSISVHVGEIVAVVGASGSGKTLLADAILGLYEPNASVSGRIWFDGVLQDAESLAALRGNGISLVPQSVNHLDPLMKVGRQVRGFSGDAKDREIEQNRLFARYGLDESVDDLYPFELSGGMARRVLLACALIENPKLIVADEPTPGLDLDLAAAACCSSPMISSLPCGWPIAWRCSRTARSSRRRRLRISHRPIRLCIPSASSYGMRCPSTGSR